MFDRRRPFASSRSLALVVLAAGLFVAAGSGTSQSDAPATPHDAFAAAVLRIDPAVVGILAGGPDRPTDRGGPDRPTDRGGPGRAPDRGAGFVWRADGLIVTAAHVVAEVADLRVRLADGRVLPARRLGVDELADVAVLKIAADPPVAPRAPAGALRRGDPVAAIGDPLGFAATLTVGHLSTLARPWGEAAPWDFLQHDAALNPGSSGGPLIDRFGRVVGMNVAIADGARRHVGIGLALPIAVVEDVAERLARDGAIPRPRLGLRLRPAATLRAAMPTLPDGLVIEAVEPASPAARAGLVPGDVVVAADGVPLADPRDLARRLAAERPGVSLALDVQDGDGGRPRTLHLVPAAAPRLPEPPPEPPSGRLDLGVTLAPDASRRIATIAPESAAESAGLRVGDEIRAIGARPVEADTAAALLAEAAARAGPGGVALLVGRGATTRWVVLGPNGRLDGEAPFGSNAEVSTSHLF